MKRVLLVAINAKYIHSNLAVYCLKAYGRQELKKSGSQLNMEIDLAEYTINQLSDEILMDLYRRRPDVLCFSCYIWNKEYVTKLIPEIGKLLPETDIWVGGPEVSYDAEKTLQKYPVIKGVMKGEGEETFAALCKAYETEQDLLEIAGISYRNEAGTLVHNPWRQPMDLSLVPFVYEDMEQFANKIIYYESSRGCPFNCSYCLSSIDKKLRFRNLELVKKELQFFIDHQVPQVKFVDRTFNCKHTHSLPILQYIKEHDNGITNFHFEVAADILTEEEMAVMEGMRPGLIQLEIGVQSTNPDTVKEIHRTMDFERVKANVARVKGYGNIHQHLDLIAGLPYENLDSFKRSFDDVFALRPDQLQLGFLKVLKGSFMGENQENYGLFYRDEPPYEVLYTNWLTFDDVITLKGVEEMVEVYYNSGQFANSIEYALSFYNSAYEMFEALSELYRMKGLDQVKHKRSARYDFFLSFVEEKKNEGRLPLEAVETCRELLTIDYYLRENAKTRPDFAGEDQTDKTFVRAFYEEEQENRTHLPKYEGYDKNQLRKMTHLETFPKLGKTILFDYMERNPLNQDARTCMMKGDGIF